MKTRTHATWESSFYTQEKFDNLRGYKESPSMSQSQSEYRYHGDIKESKVPINLQIQNFRPNECSRNRELTHTIPRDEDVSMEKRSNYAHIYGKQENLQRESPNRTNAPINNDFMYNQNSRYEKKPDYIGNFVVAGIKTII